MEDIITITGKYFFLYYTCTLDLSNIHTISLVVYFIIIYKIKKKIHYEFTTIKILDLANKRQRNTILANISYKQWTIEGNQYSHTFIVHNKYVLNYKPICFNCVHLFCICLDSCFGRFIFHVLRFFFFQFQDNKGPFGIYV